MKSGSLAALRVVFSCFGRFLESLLSDVFLDWQNVDDKSRKKLPGPPKSGHRGARFPLLPRASLFVYIYTRTRARYARASSIHLNMHQKVLIENPCAITKTLESGVQDAQGFRHVVGYIIQCDDLTAGTSPGIPGTVLTPICIGIGTCLHTYE